MIILLWYNRLSDSYMLVLAMQSDIRAGNYKWMEDADRVEEDRIVKVISKLKNYVSNETGQMQRTPALA